MNTAATPTSQVTNVSAERIAEIVSKQRQFFKTGGTLPQAFREEQLNKLRKAIIAYEKPIQQALHQDLNKSAMEAYTTEIAFLLEEISQLQKQLCGLMKPKAVDSGVLQFPAKSYILQEPYGLVLNIAPWNYPFQLSIAPVIGAIAAGNTVIIKPSEFAPHTSNVIAKMIGEFFEESYLAVVEGDVEVNQTLLTHKFDYIFFTGSTNVGKIVMRAASEHLTPVTLELGGKSPCIVDKTADIAQAAKRIMWGKTLNAGQTCIAPDYLLVHNDVKDELITELRRALQGMFGANPLQSQDYPKMISQRHYERVKAFLQDGTAVIGGQVSDATHQISPTVLEGVSWDSPVMQEEIFGAVLPLMTYHDIDQVISEINERAKPLALYLFTKDGSVEDKVLSRVSFGGGCVNDTLMHITNSQLPFGGVGDSGMGAYHGAASFHTFSHAKGILKRGTWLDVPLRYPPYSSQKLAVLKKVL